MDDWIVGGRTVGVIAGANVTFRTLAMRCPDCQKPIIKLEERHSNHIVGTPLVYPAHVSPRPVPAEVPPQLAEDFSEAVAVMQASSKASAALSRRCLQALLRMQGFDQHDLAKQIDAVLAAKLLPAPLSRNLDAVRNIGNFAAHPMKDLQSGAIVEVEPHEAEWNLDVLEGLFDFYYVQPSQDQARIDALNKKLAAAGKPAIK